ncbi:hypothetical protein M436DRAFT_66561 [Aureobasidium namibiae CBS 147.97]|uniref:BRCT domain-containing protein n=1 Tax=Aureobasidium namibiae CBS 147.97 TaxID=1043004 RepID=A0A074WF36_9PEZI
MPSWRVSLTSPGGERTHTQNVDQRTHATIYIEGNTADADTWRFVKYDEETQARRDWISQFIFVGGAIRFSSDIVDTFVRSPPPVQGLISRVSVPYTAGQQQHCVLLRHGDMVEFEVTRASVQLAFDPGPEYAHVQVESSGPGAPRIKHEIKQEADTDDEADDEAVQPVTNAHRATSAEESQHLFSTSREHLSSTPRPVTRESQVVKETPNRRRIRSQNESTIPESLPIGDTYPEQPQFTGVADPDNGLPGTQTGELPDTSPSETLHFHVPTQPTPSPLDQSFSAAEVGMLLSNLNEDNPPSQALLPIPSKEMPSTVVVQGQIQKDSSTEGPTEGMKSPDTQTAAPTSDTALLSDVASPVDIINDEITNDMNMMGDQDAAVTEPKRTPSVIITSRKRKTVSDSDSVTLSAKRAKLVEADTSTAEVTPVSTASGSSSRTKSLDEGLPPRRVSQRHKSIDSENAPSGSPSHPDCHYKANPPVILYSNTKITDKGNLMKFLQKQGASQTEDIKKANFLCVGPGELLKTPKLLHSLTLGKTIVTDKWVSQSTAAGSLLDAREFLPEELKPSRHLDRTKVFTGQVIYITPAQRSAYKKGWDDVMAIIRQAGGTNPLTGPLSKHKAGAITLYLGADKDDDVAAELQKKGETVYKKDILGASIVHGELLTDASLELVSVETDSTTAKAKAEPKCSKKGGRKKKKN